MKKITFYLSLVLVSITTFGQTSKEIKVDSILNKYFPDGFNGNVLFASNDSLIFNKSYGYRDIEKKEPLNDSSVFELASCSKQFTALAILKLQELGKLSTKDSLTKFFPQLPYSGITIYHLLTHTSGLTSDYGKLVQKNKVEFCSNDEIITVLSRTKPKLNFKPGDKWEYCNTGYIILASIIENVSGLSFNDFLQNYFFKPLSMYRTSVYNTQYSKKDTIKNYAYGFIKPFGRLKYHKSYNLLTHRRWTKGFSCLVGHLGVNSSVIDLVKWDNGLRNYKVLSKESLKLAYDSTILNSGKKLSYGFGYHLYADKEVGRVVIHTGGATGYQSLIYRLIDANKILIILTNKVYSYSKDKIIPAGNQIDMLLSGAYKNSS